MTIQSYYFTAWLWVLRRGGFEIALVPGKKEKATDRWSCVSWPTCTCQEGMLGNVSGSALSVLVRAKTHQHRGSIPPLGRIDLMTTAGGPNQWGRVKGTLWGNQDRQSGIKKVPDRTPRCSNPCPIPPPIISSTLTLTLVTRDYSLLGGRFPWFSVLLIEDSKQYTCQDLKG